MRKIRVELGSESYDVIVGDGLLDQAAGWIPAACGGVACALVTDSNVGALYDEQLVSSLEQAGIRVLVVTLPAGEESKSLDMLGSVLDAMADYGLDRKSFVIALGGGVVGDLAGFAASIYCRGIPFAQIPTSLLAQVDSSVGGKTGLNITAGKNLVGAFHQPRIVVADTAVLGTLPRREFTEGLGEIVKHGAIADATLMREAAALAESNLDELVAKNVAIKAGIVAADVRENRGRREMLNFGHTIGHAIEQVAGYGYYLHGEAVALGMVAALEISRHKVGLSAAASDDVVAALSACKLPTQITSPLDRNAIFAALGHDKKFEAGRRRFVLLEALARPVIWEDVSDEDIHYALDAIGA